MAQGSLVTKEISAVAITAGTAATVWTPASGKKFRLFGWSLSSSAAASLIFKEGAGSAALAQPTRTPLLAAAGVHDKQLPGDGVLSATADNVLKLDVSATSTVTGIVYGFEES